MARRARKPHFSHTLSCLTCGTPSRGPVDVSCTAEVQWCDKCQQFTPHAATTEKCVCVCGNVHFKQTEVATQDGSE